MNGEERRIISLAALGGMLELYDFAIYGTFALYFAGHFFPAHSSLAQTLETYAVLLLGFILRPIGGIVFSHLGDEHGRKNVLIYTILIMGMASLGIACLPTYQQIGVAAPILLVLLRMVQGFAVGGELPTTFVYISETLAQKRVAAFAYVMAGVFCGYLLAALLNFALSKILSQEQLTAFGWRIPFVVGGLICVISYRIRRQLRETPEFAKITQKVKLPLWELLRKHRLLVVIGVFIAATQQVFSIITIIYMPTYLHNVLLVESALIAKLMLLAIFATVVSCVVLAICATHLKTYTKYFQVFLILSIIGVPLAFYGIVRITHLEIGLITLMLIHGLVAVCVPIFLSQLFPTPIRLTGVAMCYNLSAAIFGGSVPLVVAATIAASHNVYLSPVLAIILFSLLCLIILRRYSRL